MRRPQLKAQGVKAVAHVEHAACRQHELVDKAVDLGRAVRSGWRRLVVVEADWSGCVVAHATCDRRAHDAQQLSRVFRNAAEMCCR